MKILFFEIHEHYEIKKFFYSYSVLKNIFYKNIIEKEVENVDFL